MRQRILIIGAGSAGRKLLTEIIKHEDIGLVPLGFIDDDLKKIGTKINGIPVLGGRNKLKYFIKKLAIDKVLISLPSADGVVVNSILKTCVESDITCQTIPRVKEIIEGKVDIQRIRSVQIEDLLGRPVRKPDINDISSIIKKKTILITGAAGSIGSELCHQIASYKPANIIVYDWWENGLHQLGLEMEKYYPTIPIHLVVGNIQDKDGVEHVFNTYMPTYVFHAAAHKHVPLMEKNPIEAIKNNILGTKLLAETARRVGVKKFIFISSDKAVHPKSIMGSSKLIGELLMSYMNIDDETQFITVRFGNVLDSYGSIIPLFKEQIQKREPITITDKNMKRYFMTIPEAAQLILKTTTIGKGGEIFVLDMSKPINIYELAKKYVLLSGFLPEKDIEFKIIGNRPGEKLVEELVGKNESLLETKYKEIFLVKNQTFDKRLFEDLLHTLTTNCNVSAANTLVESVNTYVKSIYELN